MFSGFQRLIIFILDVVFRSLVMAFPLLPFLVYLLPVALLISAIYFSVLLLACALLSPLKMNSRIKFICSLALGSVSFAACYCALKLLHARSSSLTFCYGSLRERCSWENGEITAFGIKALAIDAMVQTAVGLFSLLVVASIVHVAGCGRKIAGQQSA
jgi:hypothetical protein